MDKVYLIIFFLLADRNHQIVYAEVKISIWSWTFSVEKAHPYLFYSSRIQQPNKSMDFCEVSFYDISFTPIVLLHFSDMFVSSTMLFIIKETFPTSLLLYNCRHQSVNMWDSLLKKEPLNVPVIILVDKFNCA